MQGKMVLIPGKSLFFWNFSWENLFEEGTCGGIGSLKVETRRGKLADTAPGQKIERSRLVASIRTTRFFHLPPGCSFFRKIPDRPKTAPSRKGGFSARFSSFCDGGCFSRTCQGSSGSPRIWKGQSVIL